ncbi:unnamed protein product [Cuscuta campestris]|uniref:Uncharacterized protein n=1 Tax=Cuscuta campestris TaxID=132261 RepID=A0A484KBQ2_9ASTE|nr:unnamed protein product [Cuscuta campestris]
MAGGELPDTHHHPPGLKTIPSHPNISPVAGRNCQEEAAAVAQVAHSSPATTRSGKPPNLSPKVPDVLASSAPPESLHLEVGNARSKFQPDPLFTLGSLNFPAISGNILVAHPPSVFLPSPRSPRTHKLLNLVPD